MGQQYLIQGRFMAQLDGPSAPGMFSLASDWSGTVTNLRFVDTTHWSCGITFCYDSENTHSNAVEQAKSWAAGRFARMQNNSGEITLSDFQIHSLSCRVI